MELPALDFTDRARQDNGHLQAELNGSRRVTFMSSVLVRPRRDEPFPAAQVRSGACTVILADHDVIIPASAQTLAGFRAWAKSDDFPERGRFSFLDGEIFIDMSPEELQTHSPVKAEVGYVVIGLNKKLKRGTYYSDRALLTNEAANLSTEPDAHFVTWEALESGRVRFVPRENDPDIYLELEGTPDWVLEVVSKTSVGKDTRRLRRQYHAAGIPEYWLIDARGEEIDFQILVWEEGGYVAAAHRGGWQTSRVFRRRFRFVRRRGRLNLWEYTLQVKGLR
jgi:Uma2 family endonuclease